MRSTDTFGPKRPKTRAGTLRIALSRARRRRIIAGYYTFSAASVPVVDLPEEQSKRLPRYPVVPAALVGRLAVDQRYRGKGVGAILLSDAVKRATRSDAAVFAIIVDAKDDQATAFYKHHGFRSFASRPSSLFLPVGSARKLI
jgi:GNAT superfamily N-acetyltransferase